jgi:hypothetical protein
MAIDFPSNPTLNAEYSSGSKVWYWTGSAWKVKVKDFAEIIPLDNIESQFDGFTSRFIPTYQGIVQTISNPFRLLLAINGIIQIVRSAEYVWQSPIAPTGITVDNDGYIVFPEAVPAGSEFNARLMAGPITTTSTTTYPFKALDIILGG